MPGRGWWGEEEPRPGKPKDVTMGGEEDQPSGCLRNGGREDVNRAERVRPWPFPYPNFRVNEVSVNKSKG